MPPSFFSSRMLTAFLPCRAPVLFVKGRQHKVKIQYAIEPQIDYVDAALKTVFQIHTLRPPGAILVFLPGVQQIPLLLLLPLPPSIPFTLPLRLSLPISSLCSLLSQVKKKSNPSPVRSRPTSPTSQNHFPRPMKWSSPLSTPNFLLPNRRRRSSPPSRILVRSSSLRMLPRRPLRFRVSSTLWTAVWRRKSDTMLVLVRFLVLIPRFLALTNTHILPSSGIDSLMTESISQSSAKQRAGRAGREVRSRPFFLFFPALTFLPLVQTDGWCFRLYTEEAYNSLQKRSEPEIKRVSLTFALLHLLAAGQEDVGAFHYMDKPDLDAGTSLSSSFILLIAQHTILAVQGALLTLRGLNALDSKGRITSVGHQMAQLPLDPVYSRVLLASFTEGCPRETIDLVALLGSSDQLLINSAASRDAATAARSKFIHRTGDHMMLLNILKAFEELEETGERKVWCKDNFISIKAMNGVLDARKQLRERVERLKLGDWRLSAGDDAEPVLSALVGGLFSNTALRQEDGTYRHTLTKQVRSPSSISHPVLQRELTFRRQCRSFRFTRLPHCTTRRFRPSCTTSWFSRRGHTLAAFRRFFPR